MLLGYTCTSLLLQVAEHNFFLRKLIDVIQPKPEKILNTI